MKTILKYLLTLSIVTMVSVSYAQKRDSSNDAVIQAQQELVELKSMDKDLMTKAEKKAWKRKKRALEHFVNTELERERLAKMPNSPFFYGNPYAYNRYNGYYGNYYNPYPVYRRPVVIIRQPANYTPTPAPNNGYRRQARK
ncbi:MAG: hypothetical protein SF052_00675 [Bacteroidia bacterium]|nr:hypothetical protein [Bacteroidia bacterium]